MGKEFRNWVVRAGRNKRAERIAKAKSIATAIIIIAALTFLIVSIVRFVWTF